jgi:hypothetical protein
MEILEDFKAALNAIENSFDLSAFAPEKFQNEILRTFKLEDQPMEIQARLLVLRT